MNELIQSVKKNIWRLIFWFIAITFVWTLFAFLSFCLIYFLIVLVLVIVISVQLARYNLQDDFFIKKVAKLLLDYVENLKIVVIFFMFIC